ncbi:hypothetical protein [Nodularia sp. UHCC 0506]|uniref:hypothetical protein n=1 Tax=Nodularia sp. UHCC 0506 TaxID=3110243 RepID=UPI002B20D3F7|nr:hypothetical protein [Nodularia sp. UHCC 0506]MEA5515778.1 hypothetical protein [Nodularia sp. UHCC 0506]
MINSSEKKISNWLKSVVDFLRVRSLELNRYLPPKSYSIKNRLLDAMVKRRAGGDRLTMI